MRVSQRCRPREIPGFTIPMRGNELTIGRALRLRISLFTIPMRGKETTAEIDSDGGTEFTIPMRGNETTGLHTSPTRVWFTIPMRGNEQQAVIGPLSRALVYDPHEG